MPFRFRLSSLLRIRAVREEIERERLQLSQLQVNDSIALLHNMQIRNSETRKASLETGSTITGTQIHFLEACAALAKEAETSAQKRLEQLANVRDLQQNRYRIAHKDFLVLEKLRERHWSEFRQQESRKEQKELDEVFSLVNMPATRQQMPGE